MIKLSYKQTKRLWTIYQQYQKLLLIHKNKNNLSSKIKDCLIFIEKYKKLSTRINQFRSDNTFRLSITDFYNMSQELQSHCTLRTIIKKFNESLVCSPVAYRKTRKAINKKIKKLKNKNLKTQIQQIN